MKWMVACALLVGCHKEKLTVDAQRLTREQATAVVIVFTELAEEVAMKQPPCCDNINVIDIAIDDSRPCASGGSAHFTGSGHYTPGFNEGIGTTVFTVTAVLDTCAFSSGALWSTALAIDGSLDQHKTDNSLVFSGPVTWGPGDPCDVRMTISGTYWSTFDGTVCGVLVNAGTINQL